MNLSMVVQRPVMTEKSLKQTGASVRYAFVVDRRATKPQIKAAVETQFGVAVSRVNTTIRKGVSKRQLKSRSRAAVAPAKKAVVTLAKGQKIDLLEVKQKP